MAAEPTSKTKYPVCVDLREPNQLRTLDYIYEDARADAREIPSIELVLRKRMTGQGAVSWRNEHILTRDGLGVFPTGRYKFFPSVFSPEHPVTYWVNRLSEYSKGGLVLGERTFDELSGQDISFNSMQDCKQGLKRENALRAYDVINEFWDIVSPFTISYCALEANTETITPRTHIMRVLPPAPQQKPVLYPLVIKPMGINEHLSSGVYCLDLTVDLGNVKVYGIKVI